MAGSISWKTLLAATLLLCSCGSGASGPIANPTQQAAKSAVRPTPANCAAPAITPAANPATVPEPPIAVESIQATIPLGSGPDFAVAGFDSIWVSDHRSKTIFRIDPQSNTVIGSIGLTPVAEELGARFSSVRDVSFDPLFVGPNGIWAPISTWPNGAHNELLRIDPSTNQISLKIPIDGVVAVADLSDGVWAATDTMGAFSLQGGTRKRLLRLDPLTGKTLRTIDLGPAGAGEHYTADGFTYRLGSFWAIVADHEVDRVDPLSGRVTAAVRTPGVPFGMTNLAFQGNNAFVAESDGTIARIDAATNCVDGVMYIGGRNHPTLGQGPTKGLAVEAGPGGLYVSFDGGGLALVDSANLTVVKSVRVDDHHGLNTAAEAYGSIWYPTFDNGTVLRLKPLA